LAKDGYGKRKSPESASPSRPSLGKKIPPRKKLEACNLFSCVTAPFSAILLTPPKEPTRFVMGLHARRYVAAPYPKFIFPLNRGFFFFGPDIDMGSFERPHVGWTHLRRMNSSLMALTSSPFSVFSTLL